jgi:hypothetical protein
MGGGCDGGCTQDRDPDKGIDGPSAESTRGVGEPKIVAASGNDDAVTLTNRRPDRVCDEP